MEGDELHRFIIDVILPSFWGGTCGLSCAFSLLLLLVSGGTDCWWAIADAGWSLGFTILKADASATPRLEKSKGPTPTGECCCWTSIIFEEWITAKIAMQHSVIYGHLQSCWVFKHRQDNIPSSSLRWALNGGRMNNLSWYRQPLTSRVHKSIL